MLQFQTFNYLKRLTNYPRLLIHLKPSDAPQRSDEGHSGPNFSGQTIKKFSEVLTTKPGQCTRYNVPATASNRGIMDWLPAETKDWLGGGGIHPLFQSTRTAEPYSGDKATSKRVKLATISGLSTMCWPGSCTYWILACFLRSKKPKHFFIKPWFMLLKFVQIWTFFSWDFDILFNVLLSHI
jgi:hypothetical protein